MSDKESNTQRKKREAREFNERKIAAEIRREQRIADRIAYDATPEGREKTRISRKRAQQFMMIASALYLGS